MDERLRFVARLLDGEKMAALCREFDVSRKTGYKIFQRYKDCGFEGLTDRMTNLDGETVAFLGRGGGGEKADPLATEAMPFPTVQPVFKLWAYQVIVLPTSYSHPDHTTVSRYP
jgi:hypothetical protein